MLRTTENPSQKAFLDKVISAGIVSNVMTHVVFLAVMVFGIIYSSQKLSNTGNSKNAKPMQLVGLSGTAGLLGLALLSLTLCPFNLDCYYLMMSSVFMIILLYGGLNLANFLYPSKPESHKNDSLISPSQALPMATIIANSMGIFVLILTYGVAVLLNLNR